MVGFFVARKPARTSILHQPKQPLLRLVERPCSHQKFEAPPPPRFGLYPCNISTMDDSYSTRVKQLSQIFQDDPVLLALHESCSYPSDGRKWSNILYPNYQPVNPMRFASPTQTKRRETRKERAARRRIEMQGQWPRAEHCVNNVVVPE